MTAAPSDYQRGWRRMLVDMEIPAWDERFLARFDPQEMADLYARAGATSVMLACKALTGLCLWPTAAGEMHPGLGGRDVTGEGLAALRERGIAACIYYSVIFDNWAYDAHPEWRVEPLHARAPERSAWDRHGCCCPNNPGYRAYVAAQIADLYGRYEAQCAFCDMTFWPAVCGCRHCRDRLHAEEGIQVPETIDWTDPSWCAFQAARERWIVEFTAFVTDAMRAARPGIAVYHNFAPALMDWTWATPFAVAEHQDFLGGDLYGDELEQLVVTKLMRNLSASRPAEFMAFCTTGTGEHVELKRPGRLRRQALAAAAESTALMLIDAIEPDGGANPGVYDLAGETFVATAELEPWFGGEPLEDVAVYFSDDAKMRFADNGRSLAEPLAHRGTYPHLAALRGACRILQRAHVPFGVITRRQLHELGRHRVLVLPNVLRMDAEEVEAIRAYVRGGGRLYASRYSSLVETSGTRHDDFPLGDVFGVRLAGEDPSGMAYATPAGDEAVAAWLAPQRHVSVDPSDDALAGGLLRLRLRDRPDGDEAPAARALATLTLPYGHPHVGDVADRRWASIHSWPPWSETGEPAIVEHAFGEGRAIYSAFDVEREDAHAADRLFAGLIERLLGDERAFACEVDARVHVSAFHHPDRAAVRVAVLNADRVRVEPGSLHLRAPHGTHFVALEELPSGRPVPFEPTADGGLRCTIDATHELSLLLARYDA